MKSILALFLGLAVAGTAMANGGGGCAWPPALWDGPHLGARLAADPDLKACALALVRKPGSRLVIRHALGDDAALEASELRHWLLALALEPAQVELREDAKLNGPLQLSLEDGKR